MAEAVNEQMEMAFMDDGMERDPVSGNEIPTGSLAEEVRDDVPAMLSEGEYVVPADVLRFYGIKFFEDLRIKAKEGLARMESMGRIGGEPIQEEEGESSNVLPFPVEELETEEEEIEMATGGYVGYDEGGVGISSMDKFEGLDSIPNWVFPPAPGTVVSQVITPVTNPITGEVFNAPNSGYRAMTKEEMKKYLGIEEEEEKKEDKKDGQEGEEKKKGDPKITDGFQQVEYWNGQDESTIFTVTFINGEPYSHSKNEIAKYVPYTPQEEEEKDEEEGKTSTKKKKDKDAFYGNLKTQAERDAFDAARIAKIDNEVKALQAAGDPRFQGLTGKEARDVYYGLDFSERAGMAFKDIKNRLSGAYRTDPNRKIREVRGEQGLLEYAKQLQGFGADDFITKTPFVGNIASGLLALQHKEYIEDAKSRLESDAGNLTDEEKTILEQLVAGEGGYTPGRSFLHKAIDTAGGLFDTTKKKKKDKSGASKSRDIASKIKGTTAGAAGDTAAVGEKDEYTTADRAKQYASYGEGRRKNKGGLMRKGKK